MLRVFPSVKCLLPSCSFASSCRVLSSSSFSFVKFSFNSRNSDEKSTNFSGAAASEIIKNGSCRLI